MKDGRIEAGSGRSKPGMTRLILATSAVVWCAYALTLTVARALTPLQALAGGAANTVPIILFGAAAYRVVSLRIVGRSLPVQAAGHVVVGSTFALLSYWLLIVLLGLLQGASVIEFNVQPFPARASAWQLLQNVTTYGIVAALAYLHARSDAVAVILSDPAKDGPGQALSRYFIRSGDEIRPIEIASIVSIAGADDYAEVTTIAGRHLVRMSLAEFERALDPAKFIRIHRSRIVNVERIERAEPAGGGRLLLHMEDGETIAASRTGTRLLRERVI